MTVVWNYLLEADGLLSGYIIEGHDCLFPRTHQQGGVVL